jgi:hypothetical protein
MSHAALGFRVKSGWAMTVMITGPPSTPRVVDRSRIELADTSVPDSIQPFHAGLNLPKGAAAKTVARLVKCVERAAQRSVSEMLQRYSREGYRITAAGIVVGSIIDPETIKNDHIRAHAEEGRLFRVVITGNLEALQIKPIIISEKNLYSTGVKALGISELKLKARLTSLGKDVDGSWRAEEKAATLAAWITLA